jgi:SAM-dependent MidA family methyltransferase
MTTVPRPPSTERSAELVAVIRAEIQSNPSRRITFSRFMELALYEPDLGYYRQAADRPTDAGDFLTAPETHPIFGWTLSRRIEEMWSSLGRPNAFQLIEYGAGSGTLALSILEGLRRRESGLIRSIRYLPVESNPNRRQDLRRRFEEAGLAWLLDVSSPESSAGGAPSKEGAPVFGVLLANEFLDALPVHRLLVRGAELRELYVAWRDDAGFVQEIGELSDPELARRFESDGIVSDSLGEGQLLEVCLGLAPWLDEAAARLTRGFMVVIDYGAEAAELYGPRHRAGTLLGYRGHRVVDDPFEQVGLTDLTAHVDFTALRHLGERRGFRFVSLTTQSEFLVAAGLEAELQRLQASADTSAPDYRRARSGIVRMLDPRHMGRFRVLTMEK